VRPLTLVFLVLLSACAPVAEAYLIGISETMRVEMRNGAIVRAEMRARGKVPSGYLPDWPQGSP
jgi:hypothetical protein